jgi:hypothetical protein
VVSAPPAARLRRSLSGSGQRRLTLLAMCVATFMMQTDGIKTV